MMIKFTFCRNFAEAETRECDWDTFAKTLSRFEAFPTKEASIRRAGFVGGLRIDENRGRADGNIISRTVATIDYDTLPEGTTVADVEFALVFGLDCAFVAYSTYRHTQDQPRFRLCVPLSRPVGEADYRRQVQTIVDRVGLGQPDNCSFVMSQLMFLPSRQEGVEPFSVRQDGEPWHVPETPAEGLPEPSIAGNVTGEDAEVDDLEIAVASQPLDMVASEVDALLENYPAEGREYDDWLRVGMALYHQFQGGEDGWKRWMDWSEKSSKHNPRQMRTKWRSFGGSRNPVTMASIIHLTGGRRAAAEIKPSGGTFAALRAEAEQIGSLEDYTRFRNKVGGFSDIQIPADMRSILASTAHEVFGRGAGIGLRDIKSGMKPRDKRRRAAGDGEEDGGEVDGIETPEWLRDWVYCEADCTFERVSVRHGIKREAFRAKFDRQPECMAMDTDAATFALTMARIPTVATTMYWPGQGRIFETEGLARLNTYFESGIPPAETLDGDEDGQSVVELFRQHIVNTVSTEREQRILIDWLAYVYQHPGKRVRWALLLYGIEGNGKTYFYNVMQLLLGQRARVVGSSSIDSSFTGWAEGAILAGIEEIRISGMNRYAIMDKLKPLITNDTIAVVHKGKDERHIPNFTSYMMMTNHADAIPVGDNDRRFCVIGTKQTQKRDLYEQYGGPAEVKAYFGRLFAETRRRIDAIGRFLLDWQLSADFDPSGRAPETAALLAMKSLHISEDRDAVEIAIEKHACAIISGNLVDVTYLNRLVTMDGDTLPGTKGMAHILTDLGYTQIDKRRTKVARNTYHYVWYRRGRMTSDEAENAVKLFHADVPF